MVHCGRWATDVLRPGSITPLQSHSLDESEHRQSPGDLSLLDAIRGDQTLPRGNGVDLRLTLELAWRLGLG